MNSNYNDIVDIILTLVEDDDIILQYQVVLFLI